jgi:hypothetical protein
MTKQMVRYIIEQTVQQQRVCTLSATDKLEINIQLKMEDNKEHVSRWWLNCENHSHG